MACYQNLKDYLQHEQIKLIEGAITKHQNNDADINGNTHIESLYCTDDERSNQKMELVVSVACNDTASEKQYYRVILFGSLDLKLKDIRVIEVGECDKSDIRDDELLNHFILPDVRAEDLERIGNELFSYYSMFAGMNGYGLSLGKIISNMNAPIFFADLPDDCLGRINLVEADIKTYHYDIETQQLQEVSGHAKPGVILLNKKKYYDDQDGELLITIAHELVHWQFHQKFFKLLVLLGTDSDTMNCKAKPVIISDSMTDIEKALRIAEWQANSLAMRLAIPSSTVDAVNNEIANDPSTYYENSGDRMQACVIKFAKIYGVSCFVAKARMRQLGYDFVDGTILEHEENGKKIQHAPFYFQPGTLKDNETYVIYPKDYKKLVQENKDFAALISSGNYIYLGYVVCRLNEKYIDVVFDTDSVEFVLSDFARNHADECCIKFCLKDKNAENYYSQYLHREYLCKEEFSETSEYYYNKKTNGLSSLIEHMIEDEIEKEDKKGVELIHKMEAKGIKEFPEIFTYIMDKASKPRLTKAEVAEVLGCSDKTIQNYRNGQQVPDNIDTVMLICLACKTSPKVSTLLIEKTVGGIPDIGLQKTAYKFLLKYTDTSLKYWNMMLDEFELPHIKQFSEKQQK